MADSTVRNKEIKKHPYKDYVNFLGNYKNGKKDDQCSDSGVSVSLTNSSNNSSSSINSDLNEQPKNFKNYLENYNNKKYHPVQPAFIKKQDKAEETKTVKTEVFIEINNAQNSVNKISKVIEINANGDNNFTISNQNGNNVSKVSKIFENKSSNESVSSKANAFKFEHNDPDANQEQKKISIGEISKKFEDMSPKSPAFVDSTKHPLKKKPSIREKSKVFEGNDNHTSKSANKLEIEIKKNICSEVSQVFKQKDDHASKLNGSVSPKPQIINAKPVLPKTESPVPAIQKSTSQNVNITTVLSPTPPPPPPPPFQPQLDVTPPPKIASPTRTLDNGPCYAPPLPPPLPPADSSPKLVNNPPKSKFSPNIHTGVNTIPKVSNGRKLDSIDGIPVPTLNKNDPRVKKIVYGALREMYGAYHDQANDYLATLPKNRVRKNNGLDSIINSIAHPSQLPGTGSGFGPPPPKLFTGHIPAVKLKSEISDRKMDPPACVQNAMMTKDKKPFTYTPGGIDLSEVRSPRMARRIEQNAHLAGAGDLPKPQASYPVNVGSLPPSTLAAMRPQPQVQVFPSGPAPPAPRRGGAPPPPLPPCNAPPPPPPPTGPLPTQKFELGDNQILERPDMTKIIPDNPMALLRKTGGPQPRKSLVDEMFAHGGTSAPTPKSPPAAAMRPSQFEQQESQRYQPPVIERGAPISPVPQQRPQYQPQAQPTQPQQYQPPKQQFQPTKQYQCPPVQQQRTPEVAREQPSYQPPIIERQPSITRPNNVQPEIKTSTAHLGSLYIPPINQQQQHKRVVSPPSPPERSPDSPGIQSPTLKEAPKPWQAKKQQEDVPTWAKKEEQAQGPSPPVQHHQQNWPQARPAPPNQQQPYNQPIGIRIDIHTKPTSPYQKASEEKNPNAVYVTQPVVLQHPGGRQPPQYQQQPKIDSQGARRIPVQVEGSNQGSRTPSTPGSERSLNRQQSWGSNPTQSNSFKIIQKITQTDDDEDENAPITERSAKFPQNYQQQVDQMRKMQVNEGSQNMNFRQVSRGPQIAGNKGPQVRTIPIQIEGDEASRPYVHPSEQVVPEPKKYTGSSIPGRSFKILQAMTAPNNCANVDDPNEASLYDQWGYDPHYPSYPPPPPYWHDYYHNCFYPDPSTGFSNGESSDNSTKSTPSQTPTLRQTPLPFWGGYMPPYSCPMPRVPPATSKKENDVETTSNPRATPLPFWGYGYPYYPPSEETEEENPYAETPQNYPQYSPYYDPYYYYYYGYPPMYPPYPYYGMSEAEDFAGYSSTDEMAAYYKTNKATTDTKPKPETNHSKANTTLIKEQVTNHISEAEDTEKESSDSESDEEGEEDMKQNQYCNPLKSIRSVNNIHVYDDGENVTDDEIIIEECSEGSDEDTDEEGSICIAEDEGYPHQLSVILEESERAESRLRSVSALSDSTTIADRSDDEEEDPHPITITLPVKLCVTVTEENQKAITSVDTVENENLNTFENNEIYTSFTLKSPSLTPSKRSPCRFDNIEEDIDRKCVDAEAVNLITEEEFDDEDGKESDESEDWWGILGKEDDFPKPKKVEPKVEDVELEESKEIQYKKEEVGYLSENNNASANNSIKEDDFPKPKKVEPKVEDVELEESKEIQYKKEEVDYLSENNYASANNSIKEDDFPKPKKVEPKVEYVELEESKEIQYKKEEVDYLSENNYASVNNSIANGNIVEKTKDEKPCNNEEFESIKSCAGGSKTVYDAVEDTDEENSGTLIEMESFVAKLEKIQKESGLWDSEREMVKTTESICKEKTTTKRSNVREHCHIKLVERNTHTDKNTNKYLESKDEANEDIDFWSTIKNDEETLEVKSNKEISDDSSTNYTEYNYSESKSEVWKENKSQHVRNKLLGSTNNCYENNAQPTEHSNEAGSEEYSDDTDSSSSDEEGITADKSRQNDVNNNQENEVKVPSIKERIQALKDSIKQKQSKTKENDIKISVKEKVSAIEVPSQSRSKTTSTKSSLKSFEEFSEEEEVDSGVTSDMSRHISDTEEFPELNKLTRYQRAATHSRLFKLLQEECDNEDQEEAKAKELADKQKNISKEEPRRRDQLSLPLNKSSDSDSFYSSGMNSPNSPVNERLVNELVQSLLKRKKGQAFRNMPKEKLYAAAAKILQEHIDDMETPSDDCNSFLSPLRDSTGYSTAAQTPQEFNGNYDEYKEYYDTWSEAGRLYDDNYDIMPSKAFRLLQEHSSSNRTGVIAGLLAKCPRVLSSKNIHKKLLKLLENPENSSPTPDKPLDSNEVTSAS